MKSIGLMVLFSALACASTSSSSSPGSSSGAERAGLQSCASPQVPAMVEQPSEVYASPDSTSTVIGSLGGRSKVCADSSRSGYGFRRVKLADGRAGYVDDSHVSLM